MKKKPAEYLNMKFKTAVKIGSGICIGFAVVKLIVVLGIVVVGLVIGAPMETILGGIAEGLK